MPGSIVRPRVGPAYYKTPSDVRCELSLCAGYLWFSQIVIILFTRFIVELVKSGYPYVFFWGFLGGKEHSLSFFTLAA